MKNQVIKVLNIEHGKKVIQYWKDNGQPNIVHDGSCSESTGHRYIYYGIINNVFNNYTIEQVNKSEAEIITLPEEFVLPERWAIKIDDHKEVLKFFKVNGGFDRRNYKLNDNLYYHYPLFSYERLMCSNDSSIQSGYTEITFEQFKKYVLKETMDQYLTLKQLKEAHAQFTCSTWRDALKNYILLHYLELDTFNIRVDSSLITRLNSEGSEEQKEYVKSLGIIIDKKYPTSIQGIKPKDNPWYANSGSQVEKIRVISPLNSNDSNLWKTKELAEASKALSQLIWLADEWNDNVPIDWSLKGINYYSFGARRDGSFKATRSVDRKYPFAFHTSSQRDKFMNEPEIIKLLETARPLL